jgi:hypothetical protein
MASSPTLRTRTAMTRISKAIKEFAAEKEWKPEEYQILFRNLEQWGRISVFLVAESFSGLTNKDVWNQVFDHLEKSLKQYGDVGFSIGLSVREKRQVEEGGMYSIPTEFVNEEEFLLNPVFAD